MRYIPLWCDGRAKECIFLLSSSGYGLTQQGVWAAAINIALVRGWRGGLRCCVLPPFVDLEAILRNDATQ